MKPSEFLSLARSLASSSASKNRTAISRAYYAAFHVGKQILTANGCPTSRHGDVPDLFQESENVDVEKAGDQLSELYSQRRKADYELSLTDVESRPNADAAVKRAKSIMDDLRELCYGPQSVAIISAIQRHYNSQAFQARGRRR